MKPFEDQIKEADFEELDKYYKDLKKRIKTDQIKADKVFKELQSRFKF